MSNLEKFSQMMGKSPFKKALNDWNKDQPNFCIPRRGTKDHEAVMKIMRDKYMTGSSKNKPVTQAPVQAPVVQSPVVQAKTKKKKNKKIKLKNISYSKPVRSKKKPQLYKP